MGFFKKHTATSSYPGRRAQENRANGANPPAPANYGVHNPAPIPASVYQSNGMAAAAPTAQAAAAAPTTATASYNPSAYGAFPGNSAPVQATVYVPGQGQGAVAASHNPSAYSGAPIQALVYVPGQGQGVTAPTAPVAATAYTPGGGPAPVQSTAYSYNQAHSSPAPQAPPQAAGLPPPLNPSYNAHTNQTHHAPGASTHTSHLVPPAGAAGGRMRVHIPNGMTAGQKIKVQSPFGDEVVKVIPPQSQWHYDGGRPFFRMTFGPPLKRTHSLTQTPYGGDPRAAETPPSHAIAWRDFSRTAPARYAPPPVATVPVPHIPRGGPGIAPNGRHKSLIIGINYVGTRAQLRGCVNDARNMQGLLRREGFPDDGAHMLLLTDERNRGQEYQPTNENIMKAFAWFMHDVRRGDVLFFHFSGHGGQQPDKTGHEIDGYNETLIPVDYQRRGQITDDVLWGSLVYRLPEGARITALMDMCHSGTGLDLPFDYNVDTRRWREDMNPAHSAGDVVLFSGCEDAQTSADVSGGYGQQAGGAMTQAFMGAYAAVGCATYHDFLVAVKQQLRRKRFKQRPQLTASQQFDASSRIFSLGFQSSAGGIPSVIEPNHNPAVGRQLRRRVRPARHGFGGGGGGGGDLFGFLAGAAGAALIADALF